VSTNKLLHLGHTRSAGSAGGQEEDKEEEEEEEEEERFCKERIVVIRVGEGRDREKKRNTLVTHFLGAPSTIRSGCV
jgi:hypothetical protein